MDTIDVISRIKLPPDLGGGVPPAAIFEADLSEVAVLEVSPRKLPANWYNPSRRP